MSRAAATSHLSIVPADPGPEIVTVSEVMLDAIADADRHASRDYPVLIVGETGTGKELIARRIHARSGRRGALVPVNCAELRPDQAANLLFGHKRGSYTGATESTIGHVRRSTRGTLFLDEITSLPAETQPMLLRVLETGEVTPFGADRVVQVDLRVVAAAQPAIRQLLASGEARLDLFERLAVSTVVLPPLRDRLNDVVPLAVAFARQMGFQMDPMALPRLLDHSWPGNVRELKSVIARAVAHCGGASIGVVEMAKAMRDNFVAPIELEDYSRRVEERERLRALCVEGAGDWRRIVHLAGVSRAKLYRQLQKHGLQLRHFRHS
ncbi:MAG TPA: sigma 54-interacting transcriptional regulator [Gemmatimonadales bacterium]|nr:sigma 54-interacting transcriptional regulator [Gemmatimonadales bacterium]